MNCDLQTSNRSVSMLRTMGALHQSQSKPRASNHLNRDGADQEQRDCMDAIMEGDALLVLPTGGTRKIIFQIPAVTCTQWAVFNVALTTILLAYTTVGRLLLYLLETSHLPRPAESIDHKLTFREAGELENIGELEAWFSDLGISDKAALTVTRFVSNPKIGVQKAEDLLYLDEADLSEIITLIQSKVSIAKFKSALTKLRSPQARPSLMQQLDVDERDN